MEAETPANPFDSLQKCVTLSPVDQPPTRNEMHLPRRLFHAVSGTSIATLGLLISDKREFTVFLVCLSLFVFGFEVARLRFESLNRFILSSFHFLVRKGEEQRFSGILYYCLGCTVSAIIFPKAIAILSIFYLAIGDPIAAMAGLRFSKAESRKILADNGMVKSFAGSTACFLVCGFLTFFVSYELPRAQILSVWDRILFAGLGGFSAMIGELLPLRTDDNLALPIAAGALLWFFAALLNLMPGLYLVS